MSLPLKTVKVVWQVRTPFKVVSSESKNVHNVVHRCSLVSLYEITTMISSFECFCYCKPFLHTVIGVYVLQWKCLGNSFSCLDFPVSVPFWQTWFACRRLWRRSTAGHKGWNEKQEWQPGRSLNSLREVGCFAPEGFKPWGLQTLISLWQRASEGFTPSYRSLDPFLDTLDGMENRSDSLGEVSIPC